MHTRRMFCACIAFARTVEYQTAMESSQKVSGFTVLPVYINAERKATHFLYFKEHKIREEDSAKPANRTLFVVNIPPFCNQECLERLFGVCGKIENVIVQDKPTTTAPSAQEDSKYYSSSESCKPFQCAYIIFQKSISILRAKDLEKRLHTPFLISTDEAPIVTGYQKWCSEYVANRPDVGKLQRQIDDFMQQYDTKVEEEEATTKAKEGVPDEEGWVTVTRKSTKPGVARTEKNQRRLRTKERKKREKAELTNFYTFQMRESKREHIADLRKKFEEDKQRIQEMKSARRFKPF